MEDLPSDSPVVSGSRFVESGWSCLSISEELGVNWFKHAFAVDPPEPPAPNERQRVLIETLCFEVARRRLVTPALFLLELGRPLNYVSAQLLHFFHPMLTALTDAHGYEQFTLFLEQRGSIDYIHQRLEAAEAKCAAEQGHAKH